MAINTFDQDPSRVEATPLKVAVEQLVNANLYIFGHGTSVEDTAKNTFMQGLNTRFTDLYKTAHELCNVSDDPAAAAHMTDLLKDWPHLSTNFVVVLGIERLQADTIPHRRYLQSVVQPRGGYGDADEQFGQRYIIDPRFVAGYFDAAADLFFSNPGFNPRYDSALLQTTVNPDIQHELGGPALTTGQRNVEEGPAANMLPHNKEAPLGPGSGDDIW